MSDHARTAQDADTLDTPGTMDVSREEVAARNRARFPGIAAFVDRLNAPFDAQMETVVGDRVRKTTVHYPKGFNVRVLSIRQR